MKNKAFEIYQYLMEPSQKETEEVKLEDKQEVKEPVKEDFSAVVEKLPASVNALRLSAHS